MKKITFLLAISLFIVSAKTNAQDDLKRECTIKYNLFKPDFLSKNYTAAYDNWIYLMDNCKDLSVNIYKYGATIAEKVRKDPALAKRVYDQRLQYFPKNNPAKVHSDYATYLAKNKLASEDEIFALLEKAYKISPKDMSVRNIYKYFQGITDRYKDTNPQRVFDTYDDVVESVGEKLDDYAAKITKLTKDSTRTLDAKEKRRLRAYSINSKALGQVEGGLDNIISGIATCERLVPLYQRDYEANKTNSVWLRRAVSRMFNKGCQEDPLYEILAKSYADVTQSADAFNFVAGVMERNGDKVGAADMRKKAFDLETDPIKKARLKLREAQGTKNKSRARALAYEALKYNPNMGKAYLLIAGLYGQSANACGKSEFEKRMVFVAALNKAIKAQRLDPGSGASRFINSYRKNLPDSKVIFTAGVEPGSSYTIKCWIGETVRVPKG